jgi:hypothetical protein
VISLVETSRIPAAPERVWQFFCEMESHYRDWHPEHLAWRWLGGEPLADGTVWFADEWVGPLRISSRFFVDHVEPERFFRYRIGFPQSLGRAGGSFRFEPAPDGGCRFEQEVHFGFTTPIVGVVTDRFLNAVLPFNEFQRHMREEQANLAGLLSSGAGWRGAAASKSV